MNNWLTHSVTIGAFAAISFGLSQLHVSSKKDGFSAEESSSQKASSSKSDKSLHGEGPVLAVGRDEPVSSRPVEQTEEGKVYTDFAMDPFEVKISNKRHGWTDVNARDRRLVDQLVHNDKERDRLLNENLWTPRRELVYRKESLADLAEKLQSSGEAPSEVILPGFSGEEYKVTVVKFESEINEDGVIEGSLRGHLTDYPDSKVLLGYYGKRESGSISSPHLEQDISYDPREDNQVMVKSVDLKALEFAFKGSACSSIYSAHEVGEVGAEL